MCCGGGAFGNSIAGEALAGGSRAAGFGTGGARGGAAEVHKVLTSTGSGSKSPDVSVVLMDAGRS